MEREESYSKKIDKYKISDSILGKGSFGEVKKAINSETGEIYAVKILDITNLPEEAIEKEKAVIKKVFHPNIVNAVDIISTSNNCYIFMDFCDGGDLAGIVDKNPKGVSEEVTVYIMQQLIGAFLYLEKCEVMHRDIKPENILLNKGKVKIGDFGLGKLGESNAITKCGTPLYQAPEISLSISYTNKCDVFSMGLTLYALAFGRPMFTAKNLRQLMERLEEHRKRNSVQFPSSPAVSQEFKDLIDNMSKWDPEFRPTWKEISKHSVLQRKFSGSQMERIMRVLNPSNTENGDLGDSDSLIVPLPNPKKKPHPQFESTADGHFFNGFKLLGSRKEFIEKFRYQ